MNETDSIKSRRTILFDAVLAALSEQQRAANKAACEQLTPGVFYEFSSPVQAEGIPNGRYDGKLKTMSFSRGLYVKFNERERHVFLGRPVGGDKKKYFFNVLFIGGVAASVDKNQSD